MTRRERRHVLLTVSKTIALTIFGVACMALPLGVALAGKARGL